MRLLEDIGSARPVGDGCKPESQYKMCVNLHQNWQISSTYLSKRSPRYQFSCSDSHRAERLGVVRSTPTSPEITASIDWMLPLGSTTLYSPPKDINAKSKSTTQSSRDSAVTSENLRRPVPWAATEASKVQCPDLTTPKMMHPSDTMYIQAKSFFTTNRDKASVGSHVIYLHVSLSSEADIVVEGMAETEKQRPEFLSVS